MQPFVLTNIITTNNPLNDNEMKSVKALLAYVASNQKVSTETVESIVETNFNVNKVTALHQKDYETVIRFLVDINIAEHLN